MTGSPDLRLGSATITNVDSTCSHQRDAGNASINLHRFLERIAAGEGLFYFETVGESALDELRRKLDLDRPIAFGQSAGSRHLLTQLDERVPARPENTH
jgi:hypothetical protein